MKRNRKSPTSSASRPYTIWIDSAEQQPFAFRDIKSDSDDEWRTIDLQTEFKSLGRHPNGLGDYTLDALFHICHVERKSTADMIGTILGFNDGRRSRFEQELSNLQELRAAMVVCEGTILDVLASCYETDHKNTATNRKIVFRSINAYMMDYRVPWFFAGSVRLAEITTFRFLDRFYFKHRRELKL